MTAFQKRYNNGILIEGEFLRNFQKERKLTKIEDKYSPFDFIYKGQQIFVIELKSRTVTKEAYSTTVIDEYKFEKAKKMLELGNQFVLLVFKFTESEDFWYYKLTLDECQNLSECKLVEAFVYGKTKRLFNIPISKLKKLIDLDKI